MFNVITFEGGELPDGKYNQAYTAKVGTAETAHDVTFSLAPGSELPTGLTLTEGGYITGRPTQVVTDHAFKVIVSAPFAEPEEIDLTITIGVAFNDFTLASGRNGVAYNGSVAQAQGKGSLTYEVTDGTLPEGLTLAENGTLSGTPTKAGVYTFTVTASGEGVAGDSIELTLYIANADGGCGSAIGTATLIVPVLAICLGAAIVLAVKGIRSRKDK